MRLVIFLAVFLTVSAHAINRDQMQSLMDGEDAAEVLSNKHTKKEVSVRQCVNDSQCKVGDVCYKASKYDTKGVCVKKPQN